MYKRVKMALWAVNRHKWGKFNMAAIIPHIVLIWPIQQNVPGTATNNIETQLRGLLYGFRCR